MRVINSIKNISTALIGQAVGVLLSFIVRRVFIDTLGSEYLGINGLFTNILSILCLAEMGVGSAIIYSLYKPLAISDSKQVKCLMDFYRKAYNLISVIIFFIGIIIIPFLDLFIKDKPNIDNLVGIYLLFLINTIASYLFAYKRSLIIADQKNYIVTIFRYGFYILLNITQVIILIVTKNFILFLLIQIIMTVMENVIVSIKADRMYPYLKIKNNTHLEEKTKSDISKNIKAMMCHKIGGVVVGGTDNIIISSCIGVAWVGLYSNYYLIINAINIIIGQIFTAVTAIIGNLNVLASKEKNYDIYKKILFVNFWIAGFCSISLWILFNPFIGLWIGKKYLFNKFTVFILVVNFYFTMIRRTNLLYKDSMGLFWNDRYKPLLEALINLIVSILLVSKMGISGVFLGTLISTITTAFWIEPYVVYNSGFNLKVKDYFIRFIKYTFVIILAGIITEQVCSIFTTISWITFWGMAIISLILPNIIFIIFFGKSEEFIYFTNILKSIIKTVYKKIKIEVFGG